MVVLRNTNLTDETHIELARTFGELDDVKPYIAAGRKNRLKYDELFDVSNIEEDGSLVDPESPRGQANKVPPPLVSDSSDVPVLVLMLMICVGKQPLPRRLQLQPPPRKLLPPPRARTSAPRNRRRNSLRRHANGIRRPRLRHQNPPPRKQLHRRPLHPALQETRSPGVLRQHQPNRPPHGPPPSRPAP